ncbi:hypothetical protein OIDMADRAFT_52960 [Neofusicoccum parvum]|nr:hypothetical protein OIDMADRAFT_52960 [Neofusicoccum parvum]
MPSVQPKPSNDSASGQADHSVDLPRGATEDSPFIQDASPAIPKGTPEATTGGSQSSQYDNYWWYLEILGIVASIAAMVLVTITLHLVQDKPLHDWTFFFQPNTVLSALVTAAKSAMLFSIAECLGQLKWIYYWHCKEKRRLQTLEVFDGASRGPWGAVKFYFGIRSYVPIGAMASFVTILTLGMDPFTQQIISFQTRFVDAPGEIATIPISNTFNVKHTISQQYTNNDLALSNVVNIAKFQWNASWSFEAASQMMATEFEASQCSISWCLKRYMGVNVTNGILNSFSTEDLSGRLETDTATSNYVFAADVPLSDVAPWANASDFHVEFALYNQVFLWLGQKLAFNFTNQSSDEQFEDFLVFLQNTNTSGIIQNIAASITDRIRHNYDDVFARGSSLRPVVYVAVEWPWIILPVGAVLLSIIVLVRVVASFKTVNLPPS